MGIQGLLPFLKAIHTPVNIADFQGSTVAIDAYCWLHKGAFSCAEKLALGEKTEQYVYYCMKYIEYMLRKDLKPILVFDGCHLKSKADVEKTRRERRELHRKKAAQFLREGKRNEAKECLQRCVDITPQMALDLMNACRDRGVDCIVAPYEADAQLAFLNLAGIADIIVTEDSDLLLFGCEKIIFKMDFFGNGTLIEKSRLNEVLAIKGGFYTFEKFRHMCILSGCDYLPSIPGIGLARASKVMKSARQPDIRQLLKKLSTYLKTSLTVTDEYIEGFVRAENTFLYQLVFDPLNRRLCPLTPYPPELESRSLDYAGEYIQEEKAFQIALGNVDIHNYKCIAYFDPDTFVPKSAARPKFRHQLSIWDKNYSIKSGSPCKEIQAKGKSPLQGKEQTIVVRPFRRSPTKKILPAVDLSNMKSNEELASLYGDDGENTHPDLKTVRRNLESQLVFNCTPTENSGNREVESSKTSSPVKAQSSSLQIKENNDNFDDSSHHESGNSDDEKPRKCRKRKMSVTPSRPSAANIGEETFRAASSSVQETSDNSHTPSKGRNIFAVQASSAKVPKFDLNTPAIHVKSRYFVSGVGSGQTTRNTNASPVKKNLQSPHKMAASSTAQKCLNTKIQKSIRNMFGNAPICPQQNAESVHDSKPVIKTGMYKYISSSSSELQSAKDSFKNVTQKSSDQSKGYKEEDTSSCKLLTRRESKELQQPLSCFEKFQSSFTQSGTKKILLRNSSGSAFDWSKGKCSGLEIANLKLRNSSTSDVGQQGCTPDKLIKLEIDISDNDTENKSKTDPEENCLERCNQQIYQDICEDSKCTIEATKTHPSVSSLPGQAKQCSKIISCAKEVSGCVKSGLMTDNQSDEVTELQSYSYDDFLKSLSEDNKSCTITNDKIGSDSQICTIGGLEDQDITDSIEESSSQMISGDSQVTDGDSQVTDSDSLVHHSDSQVTGGDSLVHHSGSQVLDTSGMSTSLDEDKLLSEIGSRGNISFSLEAECFPLRDDIIDLTDAETDSQISSVSNVPQKSSRASKISQSKCRVSGLSRSKSKSSVKKSTPIIAGQRSIKDLIGKFQYRRSTEPVSLTQ